jgi:hypothetical protein
MPSVNNLKPADNLVAMIVGNAGSGKTSAIASFASETEPMYVFDIDHRIKGILGSKEWLSGSLAHIDFDQYDTRDGFIEVERRFERFYNMYEKRDLKYKSILIESVGSLAEMFLLDCQRNKGLIQGADLSKLPADKRKGTRIQGNIAFPVPDDYHYVKRAFHILFYNYFTAFPKCNIFLSAWTTDRYGKDPENPYGENVMLPGKGLLATNKLASELPGYFDEIWEFTKEETGVSRQPVAYKVKFNSYLAKTSIPELARCVSLDLTGKNFNQEFKRLTGNGR